MFLPPDVRRLVTSNPHLVELVQQAALAAAGALEGTLRGEHRPQRRLQLRDRDAPRLRTGARLSAGRWLLHAAPLPCPLPPDGPLLVRWVRVPAGAPSVSFRQAATICWTLLSTSNMGYTDTPVV